MRKLIMWNVVTVDGYFEGKQAWDLEFHQAAWGADMEEFIMEQLKSVDMLVFGRKTYQGMADYWTNAEREPETKHMNALPKIVCSTTLQKADWNNTTIVKDAVAAIAKLKQAGEGNMFVFGSGELCASLMKAGLFDEYRLCIAPVFLGTGRRLFGEGIPYQKLRMLEERQLQSGGVIVKYATDSE
ncbi:MAG TPA: dihydrofolate reductase family protein [Candidatus Saccharimonadales bacterium]|nr:dihydrofolate reductase family protein [Candidatus Saccharimonadales bacterium]